MSNRLQYEKSPYLLQHRDNPVDWYPWGGEAFTAAEKAEKPIFLSIGYSTCHWCHVMAHESFEDGQVAEALNRAFVSIKVDREERPDIDGAYMAACIAMTGGGGWPLTVLLTPDQKPFWAGTYLPKEALLSLLEQVERLWREDREGLLSAGEALTEHLRQEQSRRPGSVRRELASRAVAQFHRAFDPVWGGFGSAPKFPTPHNLLFLMGYAQRTGDDRAMLMAEVTLEAMYRGGLFDHVGGGFSRYSTDRRWLVPHFEKMLYDNALLLLAYAQAFQQTGKPLYRQVACRTADYVLRELEGPEGGFFCGQDADSEGVEGKYYVFTPEEVREALEDAQADLFCRRYGVTAQGNFEGSSIPNLIGQPELAGEPEEMASIRETLRRYREGRTTLHKDDKILTAWNGLMIAALARAGMVLQEPRFLAAAQRAARFLGNHLTGADGRLLARWRAGEGAIPGKLEDHAFYAWGLLELYTATFAVEYLEEARRLAQHLLDGFFDREQGGLYPYAADDEQLITRTKEAYDGAMPSGNSAAALVFSRLARLTGETQWADAARLQFAWLAGATEEQPLGHGFALLALLEELWPSAQLVCAAPEVPEDLTAFLSKTNIPGLTVLVKTPENRERLEALAPFTGDYPIPTQGTRYYLCQNGTCKQPVEHLSDLKWEG